VLTGADARAVEELNKGLTGPQPVGRLATALRQIVAIRTRAQGADHWETIDARKQLEVLEWLLTAGPGKEKTFTKAAEAEQEGLRCLQRGRPSDAEPLLRQTLELRREVLPARHHLTAAAADHLGFCLSKRGRHAEAEPHLREALAARRQVLGEDHPQTATTCSNLGAVLGFQGKYADAAVYQRRAVDIRTRVLGPQHLQTVMSRAALAVTLSQLPGAEGGKLEKTLHSALEARLAAGGEDAEAASLCSQLGGLLYQQGRYAEAEGPLRQALAIRRRVVGEKHRDTARAYNDLGQALVERGQLAEAEPFLRQAVVLHRALGPHPDLAVSCANLAAHLFRQGLPAEAEPLLREARTVLRSLGERHLEPQVLHNLAVSLAAQGKDVEAEEILDALAKETPGRAPLLVAQAANNLGGVLFGRGEYAKAQRHFQAALGAWREALGDGHPLTALGAYNVAGTLLYRGRFDEAEPLHRKAWEAARAALGPDHPDAVQIGNNLAANWYALGRADEAEKLLAEVAGQFGTARLRAGFTGLRRALALGDRSPWPLLAALRARQGRAVAAWDALESGLARGLFDDLSARQARGLRPEDRRREEELIERLNRIDGQLAGASAGDEPPAPSADALRQERDALLARLSRLEAELAGRYGVAAGEPYPLGRIQGRLPDDAALVAWVDFPRDPWPGLPGEHWACVVRRGGDPVWARLPGTGTDGAWTEADESLRDRARAEVAARPKDSAEKWAALKDRLAAQRLRPLREHLGPKDGLPAVKHLIVVPTAAIPVEAFAGQEYTVSYAPSGTMFAWLQEGREHAEGRRTRTGPPSLLALGNPSFHDTAKWCLLPATKAEVGGIAGLFAEPTLLTGPEATREALGKLAARDRLREYDFLHLSTHGQTDSCPAMQAALILPAAGPDGRAAYDGKVTAEEVLRTWKLEAELVTLSACESARGRYNGMEGYLGFSQALFLAGGRSLLLSLWPVDDLPTRLLMVRFYGNLLGKTEGQDRRLTKAEALAEARHWLCSLRAAEIDREAWALDRPRGAPVARDDPPSPEQPHPFAHPYYWAGFVLIGDPKEIQGSLPELTNSDPPSDSGTPDVARGGPVRDRRLLVASGAVVGVLFLCGLLLVCWLRGRRAVHPVGVGIAVGQGPGKRAATPGDGKEPPWGFRPTAQGIFFWFGSGEGGRSIGPVVRLEHRGEDRFYLVTAGEQRHPIRLPPEQVAQLEGLLGTAARPEGR
jgi:CHAT domain-containing protein/tetratricopeptide (TPR) repeat protein